MPQARSASQAVFFIPEIRQKILILLAPHDLATLMRVERSSMRDVAELLYSSISGIRAQYGLSEHPLRREVYREAVRKVDSRCKSRVRAACRRRSRDSALEKRLDVEDQWSERGWSSDSQPDYSSSNEDTDSDSESGSHTSSNPSVKHWMDVQDDPIKYDPEVFNLVVPSLRKKLRLLRHIKFGGEEEVFGEDDVWGVTFPSEGEESSLPKRGHIDLIRTRRFDLTTHPFQAVIPPIPPSGYTLSERFDLIIHSPQFRDDERFWAEWLYAVRTHPYFANLYRGASFGSLAITFDTLIHLYKLQIAQGHEVRLQHIIAPYICPWAIRDMQAFASVASSSLVSLVLSCSHPDRYDQNVRVSFADLPALMTIVRRDLPNLETLQLSLSGMEVAEGLCRRWLRPDMLEPGGTLERITILTANWAPSLFNLIRCLSPICTAEAFLNVILDSEAAFWNFSAQTEVHSYLRRQPAHFRRHLSTVDFADLGVFDPSQVLKLEYGDDGQPKRLS